MRKASLLNPLDIGERIAELKLLKPGWLDGKGLSLSHDGMDWLSDSFDKRFADDLPPPYLYPTADGNLRSEWSVNRCELSLEIDLKSHVGKWHSLILDTDAEEVRALDLNLASDWEWLDTKLRCLVESAE